MASPGDLFGSNFTSNGGDITFNSSALPGLSPTEADVSTGDSRRILRAILDGYIENLQSLDPQPEFMSIVKAPPQGTGPNQFRQTYTISFDMEIDTAEVRA